jgi:hypothetical protein
VVADIATVAYWYQTEPHRPLSPLPQPAERRVLETKIPPGAVLADSIGVMDAEESESAFIVRVPRPDRYQLWAYPVGSDGRPTDPIVVHPAVSAGDFELVVGAEDVQAALAGRALAAFHAVPLRRWAIEWMVTGPFPNPQTVGTEYSPALDSVFAPELDSTSDGPYPLPSGGSASWRRIVSDDSGYMNLNVHFQPTDWVAAYARAFLFSPTAREGALLLGADDAHHLWFNGDLVSSRQGRNISVADDLEVPVNLQAGWNLVLLKVADLDGGWAFQLRAADPSGELRWAVVPNGG